MATTEWELIGTDFGFCNCDYGCPCQFNGRPSSENGDCRTATLTQIDEGHYGDVKLDGLRFLFMAAWPGAIHEGNGEFQVIIDENANDAQRDAIRRIVYNEDTDELLTHYAIYCAVSPTKHEPIFAPITLEIDVEARTARCEVPGVLVGSVETVRNPVTGKPHRAQIVLPEGFGYTMLETASGTARSTADVQFDFTDKFAAFMKLHMTNRGIIRH